jgi:ABC-type lipoprotein export system ATPase subunit
MNQTSLIEVKKISKTLRGSGAEIELFKELSCEINYSELAVIFGPSGSGKSTLLHLLAGLELPDRGEILLDGVSLNNKDAEQRAAIRLHQIGIVFQFFNLLPTLTLLENAALPAYLAGVSKKEARAKAEQYLLKVGLRERLYHYPKQVSGGELQRAAVARALINSPRLILADEPTGNLDQKNGEEIIELFQRLVIEDQITVLIVSHDRKLIDAASHTLELIDGRIIKDSKT